MTEYIDKSFVLYVINHFGSMQTWSKKDIVSECVRKITSEKAADVVPVVRCKECKYSYKSWLSDILGGIWCTFWQKTQGKTWTMMHFDDFCSHGAKKDLEEQTV